MARLLTSTFGHENVIEALTRAISQNRLFPVLVFAGPSGIGKRRVALGLIQELLCENAPACGDCSSCRKIAAQTSESLLVIKPSGTQIKVEDIERVHDFTKLRLLQKARAVVIEDAHLLNPFASNSLLKLLEEPPQATYFFLVTQLFSDLLPTIRSRSQCVRFSPLSAEDVSRIQEAPLWMLQAAQGSLDTLQSLQTPETSSLRTKSLGWLIHSDPSLYSGLKSLQELKESRENCVMVIRFWQQFLRDAKVLQSGGTDLIHQDQQEPLSQIARWPKSKIDLLSQKAFDMERAIFQNVDRGLLLEDFWLS